MTTGGRRIQAAVVRGPGAPLQIETLELRAIEAHEVEVRLVATGVCHTDMYVRDQNYPLELPAVLGHEGAGVVERVGTAVTTVSPGDHVVLTFLTCGTCKFCLSGRGAYCVQSFGLNFDPTRAADRPQTTDASGAPVHVSFFGQSSFSTRTVADARNVVKVPNDVPLELLGPLGCGVQTGAGAVLNTFDVPVGSSIAIFGAGAVGLSAVMASVVAGATKIVALDVVGDRLALATELGATAVINPSDGDPADALRAIAAEGFDYTLDTTGRVEVLEQAIEVLAVRGSCGVIGAPPVGARASFDVVTLFATGRTIRGIVAGDSVPTSFIPTLVELYRQGRFPIEKLVQFYELDQVNEAMADSEKGIVVKPVLRMPD
ncbi:MAG: NAD(P)-dependent alcohol dehydrogenase [Comamonadaceae bacterium]|nr:MAG: NAD(P)-dependent alcohol dehydrogenase [Comamonadaceae bacterium]